MEPQSPMQVFGLLVLEEIRKIRLGQAMRQLEPTRNSNALAQYILNYDPAQKFGEESNQTRNTPTFTQTLIDYITRPVSAVASAFKVFGEDQADTERQMRNMGIEPRKDIHGRIVNVPDEILKEKKPEVGAKLKKAKSEAGAALEGKRQGTFFSDVLAAQRGGERDKGVAAGGFLADVVLDPLNILGVAKPFTLGMRVGRQPGRFMMASNFAKAQNDIAEAAAKLARQEVEAAPYIRTAEEMAQAAGPKVPRLGAVPIKQGLAKIPSPGQIPLPVLSAPEIAKGIAYTTDEDILKAIPSLSRPIGKNRRIAAFEREAGKRNAAVAAREASEAMAKVIPAQKIIQQIADANPEALMHLTPKPSTLGKLTDPEKELVTTLSASIAKNPPKNKLLTAGAQVNIYKQIMKKSYGLVKAMHPKMKVDGTAFATKVSQAAYRIMYHVTDVLEAQGIKPLLYNGDYGRLVDTIQEMGVLNDKTFIQDLGQAFAAHLGKDFSPRSLQAIENLQARRMVGQSGSLGAIAGVVEKSALDPNFIHPALAQLFNSELAEQVEKAVLGVGGVPNEAVAVRKLAERLVSPTDPLDNAIYQSYNAIKTAMGKGETAASAISALSKAIEKSRGFTYEAVQHELASVPKANVFTAFMDRFTTWWGAATVRPVAKEFIDSAKPSAAIVGHILNPLKQQFTPTELTEAFKFAQGVLPDVSRPEIAEAAKKMKDILQWLFKISGIRDDAMRGASVSLRGNVVMKDLNDEIRRIFHGKNFYQFVTKSSKKHPISGETFDFSQTPISWLDSWMAHEVDNPIEYIYQMSLAVERTTLKYAFIDEAIARWATKVARGNVKFNHHRAEGWYFPRDIGRELQKTWNRLDEFYDPTSKATRNLAAVMSIWKRWVTIMRPGHHPRNIIGDYYNAMLDGVSSPIYYTKAMKVIKAHRSFYAQALKEPDIELLEMMLRRRIPGKGLPKVKINPKNILGRTASGHAFTNEQVYANAHRLGILPRAFEIEDIYGGPAMVSSKIGDIAKRARELSPTKGKITDAAAAFSEVREHWMRLGHFIGRLEKSRARTLDQAFEEAARAVKKWHPDGTDLTGFEQYIRLWFIPFYSWNRKIIPLMIEGLLQKPSLATLYPKGVFSLQEAFGIEAPSVASPFPNDQLYPEFMKEMGIGPIGDPDADGLPAWIANTLGRAETDPFGNRIPGYTNVNPSNPFLDTLQQYQGQLGPLGGAWEQASPAFRIPGEILFNETAISERPIVTDEPGDLIRYILENLPLASDISRTMSVGRSDQEGFNESLINYLTGLGIRGVSPYSQLAEREQQAYYKRKGQ